MVEIRLQDQPVIHKFKTQWLFTIKKQAEEFCLNTGLHGYKYIGHNRRTKIERVLWGITVLIAMSCAAVLMHTAWEYNSSRSTLTVIKSTHRGIWNYPFPAVTVCNLNRISLRKAKEFVNTLKIPNDLTRPYVVDQMRYLLTLLDPGVFGGNYSENTNRLQGIFDDNNVTVTDAMRQISPDCSRLLIGCKWKGNQVDCGRIIKQSLSRDGFCCSFNYTSPFNSSVIQTQRFERVTACGYQTGVTIAIDPEPDDYSAPLLGSYGVKILLHFPYDYPDYNAVSKLVGMGYQVFLSISPTETYSTPVVKKLSVSNRKCLFYDERLAMSVNSSITGMEFYHYSYVNCMTACRAQAIKFKCGCLPFYYDQKSTRVCNLKDVECMFENQDFFETSFPGYDVKKIQVTSDLISNTNRPCNCLPDCTLYQYEVEDSQGSLKMTKSYADDPFLKDLNITSQSTVHIFFADLVSLQYCRNVYFDWHNLFASFGGLLGLFAGFSLMSGCELIYFFIIRITSDTYIKNKNENSSNN